MTIWKTIPEFVNYEASNTGFIRRSVSAEYNWRTKPGKVLKPFFAGIGNYYYVTLHRKSENGKHIKRKTTVHRIIARVFLGQCPEGLEVNHKDGDKYNNNINNLEYVTRSKNQKHAYDNKLMPGPPRNRGSKNSSSKLKEAQVREIKKLIDSGFSNKEISVRYGVSPRYINRIRIGETWGWL